MIGQLLKGRKKNKKSVSTSRNTTSRFAPTSEQSSTTWICNNSACRLVLSIDDVFCRRCSCCICRQFDDNKDPSLWLVCESESPQDDSCGLSCHIECAFRKEKLGVVKIGRYMHLDGSYCCATCGKVSGILGCWKKQLAIAKDARRVHVLCHRISLSYRLLEGTDKFKVLHEIITEAKTKLEAEVGPITGYVLEMDRALVCRLAIGAEVQKLCSHAIDKANELLANVSTMSSYGIVGSLPTACRLLIEKVSSSSIVMALMDIPTPITDSIIGYKLWYCKTQHEAFSKEPSSIFSREKRRILVTHLRRCTEYTFRIIPYTEAGDLGYSEAKCFTKSVEISNKNSTPAGFKKESPFLEDQPNSHLCVRSCGFKIRDLGNLVHRACAPGAGCLEGLCSAALDVIRNPLVPLSISRELNRNVVSVPDLNEYVAPLESSREEDNGPDAAAAAASNGFENNELGMVRSNDSGPSDDLQAWAPIRNGDVPAVDSLAQRNAEIPDCESAVITGSPFRACNGPRSLDYNSEYYVNPILRLERQGYIEQEFRLNFLTWLCGISTEQERHVLNTLIQTLIHDPKSLADQLIDTYGELISS